MNIFSIAACAVCAVIFGALVKRSNREYAVLACAGACVVILLAVMDRLAPLISEISGLAAAVGFSGEILPVVLKAVGIALVGQLAVHVCKDAGEASLAYTVDLAGKAAVLAVSLPLFEKFFGYLQEIVKL